MIGIGRAISHRLKGFNNNDSGEIYTYLIVLLIIIVGVVLKLGVLTVGAPYVTIDDQTLYEGGFLVWFGQAPPQRMYLESWLVGISNILTYIGIAYESGKDINSNIVALAYQSFHQNPDPFVTSYRVFALILDAITAFIIFQSARLITGPKREINFVAIAAVSFYVLSFNTLWCYIVARPDTIAVFFSSLGLFYYLRAAESQNSNHFWLSAIAFGLATGMKLHAGYFVFLVILDRMRIFGFWSSLQMVIPFGIISVAVFSVSAGSPLFDPLLYIKLRVLNAIDDASPWLHWGDQVWTILRGTGWLIVPILLVAGTQRVRLKHWRSSSSIATLAVFSIGWLLLFLSIRQLRAYWMLPALPVFYLFAVTYLDSLKKWNLKVIISAVVTIILTVQMVQQFEQFKEVEFNGLRSWIKQNISEYEVIYIFGYEAVNLPKSEIAINELKKILNQKIDDTRAEGQSFTERHIRNWEERSRLILIDMLEGGVHEGHTYYSLMPDAEPFEYQDVIASNNVSYIFLQKQIKQAHPHPLADSLTKDFIKIDSVIGPGGGGKGLIYDIYKRQLHE